MNRVLEKDAQDARKFYAASDVPALVAKYPECEDPEIRSDWINLAIYLMLREDGVEHVWAAMRACRRATGVRNVDRHFSEKARYRMNHLGAYYEEKLITLAKRAGINPHGKFYVGGLGRYNDPAAWVSTADDVLAAAKRKNLNVEGLVNHKAHEPGPPPAAVPMAPDILQRYERNYISQDPALKEKVVKNPKARRELHEKIISKHAKPKR